MRCSRALVVAGLAIVLLSEIQRTQAADPGHSLSATMCAAMMEFDCSQHVVTMQEILCGTDKVTYPDYCVFAKARCQSSSTIRMDHKGPCIVTPSPDSHMTTIPPNTVTWGHDPAFDLIKDVFCTNINLIICGNNVDSDICATDGRNSSSTVGLDHSALMYHLVLTHLDEEEDCLKNPNNLNQLLTSPKVQETVKHMSEEEGIPPNAISYVRNSVYESRSDTKSKVLFLHTFKQIVHAECQQEEKRAMFAADK